VNHGLETCSCVLQVRGYPLGCSIPSPCAAEVVRVFAVVVACKGVIEIALFNDDFDGCVVSPFQTEEASQEIFGTLACVSVAAIMKYDFDEKALRNLPLTCGLGSLYEQ